MSETIRKSMGEGHAKGEIYAALAYDTTDKFGGLRIKGIYITKTLTAAAQRALEIATTNALTSGTIRSFQLEQTHTGAGAIAEGLTAIVKSNVALGSWANAIYGKLDFQTIGKVTGMGGVICAELTMAGGSINCGTYATFQAEINCPTSYSSDRPISVMRINSWGAQKAKFDDYGYLLDIQGVTAGNAHFFCTATNTTIDHALRIRIATTTYYIGLYDARS